jgi:tRNA(fMet)-specific endonuclease VapC
MPGKFLLDTNVIIALFSGAKSVTDRLTEAEVFVPSTALGELYYGARKSARAAENLARIEQFAAAAQVLSCDAVTAWIYGDVRNHLRLKARPIPENDLWIAAIAIQHGLTLATRDEHFNDVDDLKRENW